MVQEVAVALVIHPEDGRRLFGNAPAGQADGVHIEDLQSGRWGLGGTGTGTTKVGLRVVRHRVQGGEA